MIRKTSKKLFSKNKWKNTQRAKVYKKIFNNKWKQIWVAYQMKHSRDFCLTLTNDITIKRLKLHKKLIQFESSLATQIRTKRIKLTDYLFNKKVSKCYVITCKKSPLSSKRHVQRTHLVFCRFARHDDKFATRLTSATRIVWLTELDDNSTASFSLSNSSSYIRRDSSREIWAESGAIDRDV
jgi:hypothetical protein